MPEQPLSILIREIMTNLIGLIRSEVQLARVEVTSNVKDAGKESAKIAVCALLAALGGFSLLAALVISIGDLMGGRYALGALLVALSFFLVAGWVGYRAFKRIGNDTSLPLTRMNLRDDRQIVQNVVGFRSRNDRFTGRGP